MRGNTGLHLHTKRSRPTYGIRDVCVFGVRCRLPKDNLIQEMIDQEEFRARIPFRPIHVTVKRGICHIECSFPHIGEFWRKVISGESGASSTEQLTIDDVRHAGEISPSIHESHEAFARINHGAKGRPGALGGDRRGRRI
jgi:hypothetical protein